MRRHLAPACTLALSLAASGAASGELRAQIVAAESTVSPENRAVDAAIRRALAHLKMTQKPSGAWDGGFGEATSITSLAVMAYLAVGHVPGAPGPYRDTLVRGVRYVVDHQHPDGMLVSNTRGGPMYCHGISTLMLAEVVGMIPDPALAARIQTALSRAVLVIIKSQDVHKGPDHAGGWRYQPNSNDSDLSVTGWQVMALRAAKSAGCSVDSARIERAVAYLKRCAVKDGGFAYQPRQGANNPRTGVGILALEICGSHHTPEALAGSKYLLKHPPQWGSAYFFYEAYYCSQAMFQIGPEAFRGYQTKLISILLEHQQHDGSWLSGDGNDQSAGRNYCTAMGVLALAVEFGYLPIYQR
jgi:Prenyltransferase and squalene oxidase repeat